MSWCGFLMNCTVLVHITLWDIEEERATMRKTKQKTKKLYISYNIFHWKIVPWIRNKCNSTTLNTNMNCTVLVHITLWDIEEERATMRKTKQKTKKLYISYNIFHWKIVPWIRNKCNSTTLNTNKFTKNHLPYKSK